MSPVKVLIVEDETLVADDLRETLELLGYEVPLLVSSGEEALNLVASVQPDLVLMDIRLSGSIDGIETSQMIQTNYRIPVVYLTANADRITLERVKSSHPFGYILKPFNENILATTLEIALARHQAESEVYNALQAVQVRQQTVQAEIRQKSEYFSLVAHELRNPLTAIKFATELLQNQDISASQDKRQRYLHRIQSAAKNLNDLIEDVLLLETATTSELQYVPTMVDLVNFCQDLVEAFQLTSTANHQIVFSSDVGCLRLSLDEKLLWHLLSNLLANAIKYSPEGGMVSVSLRWEGNRVFLQVQDEGIGIPVLTQAKLFEPFQRGANVGSIPGTGLGLAIAKKCVEIQGGEIWFKSAVGEGTTFTVSFLGGQECGITQKTA